MYCQQCGGEIPDNASFCSKCGSRTDFAMPQTLPRKASKNKLWFWIGGAMGVVLLILAVVLLPKKESAEISVQALLQDAQSMIAGGNYEEARLIYEQVLQMEPANIAASQGIEQMNTALGVQNKSTPAAQEAASSDITGAMLTNDEVGECYLNYIKGTLLPNIGLASWNIIKQAMCDISIDGYEAADTSGIMSVCLTDLDDDGQDEAIVPYVAQPGDSVSLKILDMNNNSVIELPGGDEEIQLQPIGQYFVGDGMGLTIEVRETELGRIIYCYVIDGGGDSDCYHHYGYVVRDGKILNILDMTEYYNAYGHVVIECKDVPEWLSGDFPSTPNAAYWGENNEWYSDKDSKFCIYAGARDPSEHVDVHLNSAGYRVYTHMDYENAVEQYLFDDYYKSSQQAKDTVLAPIINAKHVTKVCEFSPWEATEYTNIYQLLCVEDNGWSEMISDINDPVEAMILQGISREFSYEELYPFSQAEVALIRNGMFAFSGEIFSKAENQRYFSSKKWYTPIEEDVWSWMNDQQRANVDLCKRFEKDMGW